MSDIDQHPSTSVYASADMVDSFDFHSLRSCLPYMVVYHLKLSTLLFVRHYFRRRCCCRRRRRISLIILLLPHKIEENFPQ